MPKSFMPIVTTKKDLAALQLEGLKWTVNHVYRGSPLYRKKFDEAGVKPADIKKLTDLKRLPFTTADDLKAGYPFPLLSVPMEKVVRIHASSGTTGKRKVLSTRRRTSMTGPTFSRAATRWQPHERGSRPDLRGLWSLDRGCRIPSGRREVRCAGDSYWPGEH